MEKGVAEKAQICCAVKAQRGLFDHEPTGGIAFRHLKRILVGQDTDEKEHQGGGHKVQGRAADGLIGPQIHGGEGEQQGEHRPQHRRHQHGQQLKALKRHPVVRRFRRREDTGLLRQVDKEHPREGTEDHNALKSQVDDTAALGKDAGQGHDHQRDRVNQGLLNQKRHACSPPSCAPEDGPAPVSVPPACAAIAFLRFFRPSSSIRISSENALRYTIVAMITSVIYSL